MKLLVYRVNKHRKNKSGIKNRRSVASFGSSVLSWLFSTDRGSMGKKKKSDDSYKKRNNTFTRVDSYRQKQKFSFERFMFFTFIIAFTLLVIVQTALISPSVRTFVNGNDEFEGTPLGVEEYLYEEGEIGLKLLSGSPDGRLKVLINGDEAAVFNNSVISLPVKDGDIVEIDGSGIQDEAEVIIITKSENIDSECANKRVRIKSGVKKLTQVKIG
ncbi:MAG: hypothetical protein N3I35_18895 [Clostridia bacterium]|nr:hypothetical protein [Clostridia bacterium]